MLATEVAARPTFPGVSRPIRGSARLSGRRHSGPFRVHVQCVSQPSQVKSSPRAGRRSVYVMSCLLSQSTISNGLKVFDCECGSAAIATNLQTTISHLDTSTPPFYHRAMPARQRAFRNSITRDSETRHSCERQCDWPRLPAGDGFPTRAGVLPALLNRVEPVVADSPTASLLYDAAMGLWHAVAICRCARST